jgi:LysR family transcriptional regulator, low CO2-responsive transcriptional regulator
LTSSLTLHKLKLFIVVYDRGSFNQAAQELFMAQSAVSQHIQSLEAALGTPLFERTSRGVRPTPAGDVLYDYAGRILQLLAEAERAIMQIDQAQQHSLSVAATPGVSVYLLPPWLQQFQQTHPNVNVSLQTALTAEVVRDVLNGRYDLGFLEGDLLELDQEALGKIRFRDVAYPVVVQTAHPWAERDTVSAVELATQPFINRQPNSRARRWLETTLSAYGVRLRNSAELDSPGAIKYALLNNMGVAVLPDYAVQREAERSELHLLRLVETDLKRPLMLVWDRRRPFSAIQRSFLNLLAVEAPQLQVIL